MKTRSNLCSIGLGLALTVATTGAEVIYSNSFTGAAGADPGPVAEVHPGWGETVNSTALDGDGHLVSINAINGARFSVKLSDTPLAAEEITLRWTMRATSQTRWTGIGFHGEEGFKLNESGANSGPWLLITSTGTRVQDGSSTDGGSLLLGGTHSAGDILSYEMTYNTASNTLDLSLNGSVLTNGYELAHEFPGGTATDPSIQFAQMQLWVDDTNDTSYIDDVVVETSLEPTPVQVDAVYSNSFTGAAGTDPGSVAEVDPGLGFRTINTALDGSGHLVSVNPVNGTRFIAQLSETPLAAERIRLRWTMRATSQTRWVGVGFHGEATYKLNDSAGNSGPWVLVTDSGTTLQDGTAADGPNAKFLGSHAAGDTLEYELTYHTEANTVDLLLNGYVLTNDYAIAHEFPAGSPTNPSIRFVQMQVWVDSTNDTANIDSVLVETLQTISGEAGAFQISSFDLSDVGGGTNIATAGVSSTNLGDIAFVLEYAPDLLYSSWLPVNTNLLQAPGGELVHTNAPAGSEGFYRIRVE